MRDPPGERLLARWLRLRLGLGLRLLRWLVRKLGRLLRWLLRLLDERLLSGLRLWLLRVRILWVRLLRQRLRLVRGSDLLRRVVNLGAVLDHASLDAPHAGEETGDRVGATGPPAHVAHTRLDVAARRHGPRPAGPGIPTPGSVPMPRTSSSAAENSGSLTVSVPFDAKVYINGKETHSTGSRRQYVSYGLQSGMSYKYVVKVQVVRNGELQEDTKRKR